MRVDKDFLEKFQPVQNYALIKITRKNNEYEIEGATNLYIDTSFKEAQHAPVFGEVIAPPKKLTFIRNGVDGLNDIVDLEIEKGDIVYFKYIAYLNAFKSENNPEDKSFQIPGDTCDYILVRYDSLIVRKRNDELYPLNGYVLCSKMEAEDKWQSDIISSSAITDKIYNHSETRARVEHVGGLVHKYFNPNVPPDEDNLSVGDIVAIDVACDIPLEYDIHQKLDKQYFRIRRKDILGIIIEDEN